MIARAAILFVVVLSTGSLPADSTVVFNELMYHPREREEELEWIELHNQMAVDMDISGWYLGDGVLFIFDEGTVVPGGGYLVVASCSHHADVDSFAGQVRRGLQDAGRNARILRTAGAAPDHPVHPALPESAYLKAQFLALD